MPIGWVAAAGAVAGLVGSSMQADATSSAADKQLQASQEGQQLLRDMYAKNAPYWYPYTNLGQQGSTAISNMLPYLTHQFTPTDLQTNLAPNYQFMLGQGLQSQRQAQNVGGGGSNIARAADIFSQNYAQNAYQQAFANFDTQRKNIYSTLSGIANMGLQGAAGLSNLSSGTATNIANLIGQGAQAQAAGQVGSANAWAGGISNAANNVTNAGLLYSLQNRGYNSGNNYGPNGNLPYQTNNASDLVYPGSNFDVSQGSYGPYAQ